MLALASCGGPAKEAAAGESCFRVSDCQLGLICGPDQRCTSDLHAIDIRPDAGAVMDAGGVNVDDAADLEAASDETSN
jgi:hypothetical protein